MALVVVNLNKTITYLNGESVSHIHLVDTHTGNEMYLSHCSPVGLIKEMFWDQSTHECEWGTGAPADLLATIRASV